MRYVEALRAHARLFEHLTSDHHGHTSALKFQFHDDLEIAKLFPLPENWEDLKTHWNTNSMTYGEDYSEAADRHGVYLQEVLPWQLRASPTFFVAEEMCDLVDAAMDQLPEELVLTPDMLVTTSGYATFERGPIVQFVDQAGEDIPSEAFTINHLFWVLEDSLFITLAVEDHTTYALGVWPLREENFAWNFSGDEAIALNLIASQRLTEIKEQHPPRQIRRSIERKVPELGTIKIINLRAIDYVSEDGENEVNWSHRWITRGLHQARHR